MAISEGRTLTITSTSSAAPSSPTAKQTRDETLIYIFGPPAPTFTVWDGKDWQLAALIEAEMIKKRGRPSTSAELTEGLNHAVEEVYRRPDGTKFKAKNLKDGLRQHNQGVKAREFPSHRKLKDSSRPSEHPLHRQISR